MPDDTRNDTPPLPNCADTEQAAGIAQALSEALERAKVAVILLDSQFRVQYFTPSVSRFIPLARKDINRHIADFSGPCGFRDLLNDLHIAQEHNKLTESPFEMDGKLIGVAKCIPLSSQQSDYPFAVVFGSRSLRHSLGQNSAKENATPEQALRLLLVDDDEDSLYLLKNSLKACSALKLELDTAQSGGEAQEKLNNASFDLCITDYRLRDQTAAELSAKVPAGPPFIVVSNYPKESLEAEIERAGFSGFLTKSDAGPKELEDLILKLTDKR